MRSFADRRGFWGCYHWPRHLYLAAPEAILFPPPDTMVLGAIVCGLLATTREAISSAGSAITVSNW